MNSWVRERIGKKKAADAPSPTVSRNTATVLAEGCPVEICVPVKIVTTNSQNLSDPFMLLPLL